MDKRYLFFMAVLIFTVLNSLIQNDTTSLWEGTESFLAWNGLHEAAGSTPQELFVQLTIDNDLDLLMVRFAGIMLLLLAGSIFWWMTKPVFGARPQLNSLLLLASSLLVVNLTKVATGDIWALATQWIIFTLLIRYLKQPQLNWRLSFYIALLVGIWVQPLNTMIFVFGYALWLYFRHPNGKSLWKLNPWIAGGMSFGLLYGLQLIDLSSATFIVGFDTIRFMGWNLLGTLPFIGFVLAGVWESVIRARKGEELSNIYLGGLLFALLGHALVASVMLAMIAGKQLNSYFADKYPYRSIVRGGAVLHIVVIACAIIAALVGAYFKFDIAGFRAGLFAGGVYWMWSFIAVIGLYGMNERYVRAGTVFSGVFFILLFWLQVMPIIETQRGWPNRLVEEAADHPTVPRDTTLPCMIYQPPEAPFSALAPYAKATFSNTLIIENEAQLSSIQADTNTTQLLLLPADLIENPVDSNRLIKGMNSRMEPLVYGWSIMKSN